MATILVTGGCGFIGGHFLRMWRAQHPRDTLVNFDALTYAGNPDNIADVAAKPGYVFVRGDIANATDVAAAFEQHRPDVVVNFAAESHNSRAAQDPAIFYQTNALGTQTLLEQARRLRVPRFHHISTCEVFGDLPLNSPRKFGETAPLRPNTLYSASKAAADLAVRAYARAFGLHATISVCANNYGARQFPEKLIPHFITRLLLGQKMPLYRRSAHRREWLHVDDHCRAVMLIINKGRRGGVYNIGDEFEESIEGVADRLIKIFGLDETHKKYVPDRPGHDRRYLLNSAKIRRELGWCAQVKFEKGFAETVQWYRENPQWWKPLLEKIAVDESGWEKSRKKSGAA